MKIPRDLLVPRTWCLFEAIERLLEMAHGVRVDVLGMRPSMRKITQQSVMLQNLFIGESKRDTHIEREREAQRISLFIRMQQLQIRTTTTTF